MNLIIKIPTQVTIPKVVNFITAVFVFVLMVDPSGNIFKIKVPLFGVLIICCAFAYPYINKYIRIAFYVYALLALTSLIGFFADYDTQHDAITMFYKNFMMIWLIPWINHIRMLEYLKKPAVFISLIVVFIYVAYISFPQIQLAIYQVAYNDRFMNTVMMGKRQFLGFNIISIYYTSAPVLMLLLSYLFAKYLQTKKLKTLFLTLIVLSPLLIGGTRAMMLSSIGILCILFLLHLWSVPKGRIFALCGFALSAVCAILLAVVLLNDSGEDSLETKKVLVQAFYNHIDHNPMTLIWGNGVGATFDSLGIRGDRAILSELFYLELIRWFGIPLMICFLLLYLYPIYLLIKKRQRLPYAMPLSIAFVFYLFLGGTNPYLIASNGFIALLTIYSYALNPYYENLKL